MFTHDQPLGPSDHNHFSEHNPNGILFESVRPFSEAINQSAILIIGRKGAGKTALLDGIEKSSGELNLRSIQPAIVPKKGQPILLKVDTWEHFDNMVESVHLKFGADKVYAESISTERLINIWQQEIWNSLIDRFYTFARRMKKSKRMPSVLAYVEDKCVDGMTPTQSAEKLHNDAKAEIINFLETNKSTLFILFDSLENYPITKPDFSVVIKGFFQALQRINNASERLNLTFCIPEEIEPFLARNSINLLKDYSSYYRLKWRPIDLMQIVAHRYRLCVKKHDSTYYAEIAKIDLKERDQIHDLIERILPDEITNSLGQQEHSIAYIMRHTQLLPRHVIFIFNKMLSATYTEYGGFKRLEPRHVIEGVSEAEEWISDELLRPYEHLYGNFIIGCREILPDTPPILKFKDWKKIEKRFKNRIDENCHDVTQTLYEMGMIGKVMHDAQKPRYIKNTRYCLGEFRFNSTMTQLAVGQNDEICFHPVFSRRYRMQKKSDDQRVVYPTKSHFDDLVR